MNKAATSPDGFLLQIMVSVMAQQPRGQHSLLSRRQQFDITGVNDINNDSITPFPLEGPLVFDQT